jgi:hypothetical protein
LKPLGPGVGVTHADDVDIQQGERLSFEKLQEVPAGPPAPDNGQVEGYFLQFLPLGATAAV